MTIVRELGHCELEPQGALAVELARLDRMLANHLAELRARGRTILGDSVGGAVIEEGEAEGLLQSLRATHSGPAAETPPPEDWKSPLEPLERARELYDLLPVERDLLLLGLSVEIDSRYARLVAFLNDHVSMTRPTLGLAMAVLLPDGRSDRGALLERIAGDGPLRRYALLRLDGDEPLANRAVVVPESFWPRLIGIDAAGPFAIHPPTASLSELELAESTREQARNAQDWARRQPPGEALVLVTAVPGSGREALARAIAAGLGANVLIAGSGDFERADAVETLEREARWHDATVIISDPEQMPSGTRQRLFEQLNAPLISLGQQGREATLINDTRRRTVEVVIPDRDLHDTTRLWSHLLESTAGRDSIDAAALAMRFPFGPGRIVSAIRLARTQTESHGRSQLRQAELETACHRLRETHFGDLAQKLACPFTDRDIVLPPKTRQELDLIVAWARHGARVFSVDGHGHRLNAGRGLACLFSGPPGTGKTMAAQVIARRIDFDVYRIDLSQVVNKYIGETEKNLSKVFDEAQRSRVILFFDEADALFGRRSEVKDAHDRYANIEVGYLLQRLEAHEGLVILATNLQKNLDDAFLRRLQVKADFPMPGAPDRRAIWERLLPKEGDRDRDVDLELLSGRFEIAGGDIRNAIFTALLLAAEDDSTLGMRYLVLGLWRELQKSGRVVDLAYFGPWRQEIEAGVGRLTEQRNG